MLILFVILDACFQSPKFCKMLRFADFNPLLQNKLRICTLDKVDINIQRSLDFLSHKTA